MEPRSLCFSKADAAAVRKSQAASSVLESSALRSRKLGAGAYSLGPVRKYVDLGSISHQLSGFEEASLSSSVCISKGVKLIPTLERYDEY